MNPSPTTWIACCIGRWPIRSRTQAHSSFEALTQVLHPVYIPFHFSRTRRFKRRDDAAGGDGEGEASAFAAARAAAASFRACVRVLSPPSRAMDSASREVARSDSGPVLRKAQHGASMRLNAPPAHPAPRRQNQYASLQPEPSMVSATLQWFSCLRIRPSESKCSSINTLREDARRSISELGNARVNPARWCCVVAAGT